MNDPLVLYFFFDELQKEATSVGEIAHGVSERAMQHGAQFMKAFGEHASTPFRAMSPEHLQKAWHGLSNTTAEAGKSLSQGIAQSRLAQGGPAQYVADFRHGTGVADKLRQGGWMANIPKYTGDSKLLQARNMAARALPGRKTLHALPAAYTAAQDLRQKEDETGRKRGLGERVTSAGMGAAMGLAGSNIPGGEGVSGFAGGLLGGHVGHQIGRSIGSRTGRAADTAALRVRKAYRGARDKETR